MPKYTVYVHRIFETRLTIEAKDLDDARLKAEDQCSDRPNCTDGTQTIDQAFVDADDSDDVVSIRPYRETA